jgi:hypothetical protein
MVVDEVVGGLVPVGCVELGVGTAVGFDVVALWRFGVGCEINSYW